jgi:zinc transport system substrate-binding protein
MLRSFLTLTLTLTLCLIAPWVRADAPRVAVDIAPVHSLVAQVMEGAGTPDLILSPGASPHAYALRPSQAAALQQADMVIWMGAGLTPAMEGTIRALSESALVLDLLAHPETLRLPLRDLATFEDDDHDHDHDYNHEHGTDGVDPHAWLDPENARQWVGLIADVLSALDPENAALYTANAEQAQADLTQLTADLTAVLRPAQSQPYLVFHDAYHYFEDRFGLVPAGAVTGSDATPAGAGRIREITTLAQAKAIRCALSEPQFNPRLLEQALGSGLRIAEIDPLGTRHTPGPALYGATLRDMAQAIATCTTP